MESNQDWKIGQLPPDIAPFYYTRELEWVKVEEKINNMAVQIPLINYHAYGRHTFFTNDNKINTLLHRICFRNLR